MLTGDRWTTKIDYMRRVYSVDDVCPTIATVTGGGMEIKILVRHATNGKNYYKPCTGGDCLTAAFQHRKTDEDEFKKEGR